MSETLVDMRGVLTDLANHGWDARETGALRGAPSAFTRNQLEESIFQRPHHNGLDDTVFTDGTG